VLENAEGVLDYNTPHERHTNTGLIPQKKAQRFLVKHLERLPLGLSYPVQIQHVSELLARPPLTGNPDTNTPPATLVVDDTGVGRAVSDLMLGRGMEPMRVTIVAGNEQTVTGRNRWHVPKALLISGLDAHLHSGNLKIAGALTESGAIKNELLDFERSVSAAGRATYQARAGKHDDLILAVAISLWWALRPPPPIPFFGRYATIID
jgi:hypothetical protein